MLDIRSVLIRGTVSAAIVNAAGAGIAFALHVLLSRLMGVEHYGVYVYVLGWLNILVLFGKLGLDTALLRYVAAYTAQQEWAPLSGILRQSTLFAFGASMAIAGVGASAVWALREQLSAELMRAFWVGFALLPLLALTHLRQAALRALRRVALAQIPEFVLRPTLLAALAIAAVYGIGLTVRGDLVMALDLVAASVAFLLGGMWLYRALPADLKSARPTYHGREWIAVALPLFLLSGMNIVHSQTDLLMIGSLLGTREAGIYAVAVQVSMLVLIGLVAVNAIAAPMISELYATGRRDDLQRMVSIAAGGVLAVSLPVALGLTFLGSWVLSFFGPGFPEGYAALVILVAGQLVNALAGSVGLLMTMTAHQREAASIMAVSVVANVVLNAALIPRFGIEGAAVATAATTVLWNVAMFVFVFKRLGINSTAFRLSW